MLTNNKTTQKRSLLRTALSTFGLIGAALTLTGCIQLDGDLKIGSDARASGKLLFSIDKSFAELAGINSLSDLKTSPEQIKVTDSCKGTRLYESPSSYVTECNVSRSVLADDTFSSSIIDGQVVFSYKATNSEGDSSVSFGATNLRVKFPGDIDRVESAKPSQVSRVNKRTVLIRGLATDNYDIKVYASCGKKCAVSGSSIADRSEDPNNPGFVRANKRLGGMITQNTIVTRANSPYTITKTLQIPQGITVKVEPGVTIVSAAETMFHVQGDLLFEGEASRPINLNGRPKTFFLTKRAPVGTKINLNYVNLNGGGVVSTNSSGAGYVDWEIKNSRIVGVRKRWHVWYPTNFLVEKSVFKDSGGIDIGVKLDEEDSGVAVIRDNLFDGPSTSEYWVQSWASYGGALRVVGNHFKGDGFNVLKIKYDGAFIDASGNYWGTTNSKKIENKVLDAADSLKYKSKIEVGSPLASRPAEVPRR
jgi:hypothetical protein